VSSLTNGKILPQFRAHLDPDLREESLPRHKGWKPLLGQVGSSQGHLRKQAIGPGDIFLFFGLFREVIVNNSKLIFCQDSLPIHLIWGWLQVDRIVLINVCNQEELKWALYHPHFHRIQIR